MANSGPYKNGERKQLNFSLGYPKHLCVEGLTDRNCKCKYNVYHFVLSSVLQILRSFFPLCLYVSEYF